MPAAVHCKRVLAGLAVLLSTAAASTAFGEETPVPMADEPYHHLLFENPYAAIYDVVLPPGALMRYHQHPTNHLAVVIEGGTLRNEVVDAPATERATGPGGTVVYIPAGPPHRQSNVGAARVRFIAAEVLAPAPAADAIDPAGQRPGCDMVQNNPVVVAWRCRLAPGDRLVSLAAGIPTLRVALGVGTVGLVEARGAEVAARLVPGTVSWFDGDRRADVINRGDAAVELVEIAWRPEAKPIRPTVDVPKNPGSPR
jgi:quercetin dioxygenase-like cupin family protein